MYFDAITLAAIAQEFRATILGGRIQRVLLPDSLSIGLEVYAHQQRYQVFASAHAQFARVHLVQQKLSRGVEQATPFLLLLRKYILGGRITTIQQPHLERVLLVSIAKESQTCNHEHHELLGDTQEQAAEAMELCAQHPKAYDSSQDVTCELIIEIMGRHSNIILVDTNNIIIESVKRVTSRMSYRVILPRQAYEKPPTQNKNDPTTATADEVIQCALRGERDLVKMLVNSYCGVSPQAAREVVYRATQMVKQHLDISTLIQQSNTKTISSEGSLLIAESLAYCLRELFTKPYHPCLVTHAYEPIAYAPYLLTHQESVHNELSMSVILETFYAGQQQVTSHRQRRLVVQQQLQEARERLERQYSQLKSEWERVQHVDQLRWEGEMIYAYIHSITSGQEVLEVEGQRILLDPSLTPAECAQKRFHAYGKARSGLPEITQRLQQVTNQQAGLEQLMTLLELTNEREQIDQIAQEAEEQGYINTEQRKLAKKQQPRKRVKPLHLLSSNNFDLYIGRSANQNDEVTFHIANPDDIWLHAHGVPGAHVIIRTGGREVPLRTLEEAAGLAAYFSSARNDAAVDVDIALRRKVRRMKYGAPGLVTYHAEQTLRVVPQPPWG